MVRRAAAQGNPGVRVAPSRGRGYLRPVAPNALSFAAMLASTCALIAALANPGRAALPADTLRGRVVDRTGRPVAGAEILLPDLDRRSVTDADGAFLVPNLLPGRYLVAARAPNHRPVAATVSVGPATPPLTLRLAPSLLQLEPLVVAGAPAPLQPLRAALPVATVARERLRRQAGVSLAHALEAVAPGVRSWATGPHIGKPILRGLGGSRVVVADGGLRLEDYAWSDEDGPAVDARWVDRVDLVWGPASLLYGPDALGGAVDVRPAPLPDPQAAARSRPQAEIRAAGNNRELGLVLDHEGARSAWAWRASAIGRRAGDYRTPAGPVRNTGYAALNGLAAVGWRGTRAQANLRYTRYGGEFRLLEAGGPTAEEEGPERKVSDDRLRLDLALLPGRWRWDARLQGQHHRLVERADEPIDAPAPHGRREIVQFDLALTTLATDVQAQRRAGAHATTAGLSTWLQWHATRGPQPVVPNARGRGMGAVILHHLAASRANVAAGLRYDRRWLDADPHPTLGNPPTSLAWGGVSANAGLAWELHPGLALQTSLGTGWRGPNLFELFANGPRLGERRYERGDPTLRPERARSVDVGLRWRGLRAEGFVQAFALRLARAIYLERTGQQAVGLPVYEHRQTDAVLLGAEAFAEAELSPSLVLRIQADAVRSRRAGSDTPLPWTPPPRALAEAEWHGPRPIAAGRVLLAAALETTAAARRVAPGERPTDAYTLLHLRAGWEGRVGPVPLRVDAKLRNATNAAYRNFLSRYKDFALEPGRSLEVQAQVRW